MTLLYIVRLQPLVSVYVWMAPYPRVLTCYLLVSTFPVDIGLGGDVPCKPDAGLWLGLLAALSSHVQWLELRPRDHASRSRMAKSLPLHLAEGLVRQEQSYMGGGGPWRAPQAMGQNCPLVPHLALPDKQADLARATPVCAAESRLCLRRALRDAIHVLPVGLQAVVLRCGP